MLLRSLALVTLLLSAAVPALAANLSADTGEPIPASILDNSAPLPEIDQVRDSGLDLVAVLADGTSKSVRALPNNVVVWQNGVWLVAHDVSVPAAPVELSRTLIEAQPSDMQVIGNMLYVAQRKAAGLLILDYTDPANPVTVGQLEGFDLLSVAVQGDRAYCGRGSAGVLVIDLTDPSAPVDITLFDTPGSANGTDVEGNILYVSMGTSGLGIYDVTDPLAPVSLATAATSGFCTYAQERDGLVYACDGNGLRIFDVSTPSAPVLLGSYSAGGSCYEMCFTGDSDIVYLAGLPGMVSLLVTNPASPIALAGTAFGNAFSCADVDGAAVMASRYEGLYVLDGSFDVLANLANGGFSMKLHLDGNILYVADLSGGVRVFDLTIPEFPVFLGEIATDPNCQDLAIDGNILYAVNSNNSGSGLTLTDVTDPASPVPLSAFNTTNGTMGLGIEGDLCVLANGFGGLRTVNVADPMAPVALGDLPFGANATDVYPVGNVAYAVAFGGGMLSIDITNPSVMSIVQQQPWGFLNALDITGNIAWVADGQLGLRVVDITDPANLVSLATVAVGGQTRDVVRSEPASSYVFLADDFYGLRQVDVSVPDSPVLIGSYPSGDRGMGVDVGGGLVVLAAGEAGVNVYRDPAVVSLEDELETEPVVPAPLAYSLKAAPNPFNPRLELSYALPQAGQVRIDVYDAAGRHVRTLLQDRVEAGTGSVTWSGTDAAGRSVASGVYHVRMVTDQGVTSRSVTLVR
jgi:hypothetical protein